MAFDKTQEVVHSRTRYDLDDQDDRKTVREFEMEVSRYLQETKEVFGKMLSGFDLYLHEKGLLRYSDKYPYGAVNASRLNEFRDAQMKIHALRELWDRRDSAKKYESQNIDGLVASAA